MQTSTCIVGLVDDGRVYIGGDSAATGDTSSCVRKDPKVFMNGDCLIGFTQSFRMGQLLRYKLQIPYQECEDDLEYMATSFVDAVKDCFDDNGFEFDTETATSGSFLVGYKNTLYIVDIDYQVGISADPYYCIGCGADLALGAMYATEGQPAMQRITTALEAASKFSTNVLPPFVILNQDITEKPNKPTKSKKVSKK
jgi:ATP-dependent protease HslVU (ClpYQ) peptidase subunit